MWKLGNVNLFTLPSRPCIWVLTNCCLHTSISCKKEDNGSQRLSFNDQQTPVLIYLLHGLISFTVCNSPPTLLNGNITSDGMTATYTCEQGYSMNGTQTRVCRQDGTGWNGEPPTCGNIIKFCCCTHG